MIKTVNEYDDRNQLIRTCQSCLQAGSADAIVRTQQLNAFGEVI